MWHFHSFSLLYASAFTVTPCERGRNYLKCWNTFSLWPSLSLVFSMVVKYRIDLRARRLICPAGDKHLVANEPSKTISSSSISLSLCEKLIERQATHASRWNTFMMHWEHTEEMMSMNIWRFDKCTVRCVQCYFWEDKNGHIWVNRWPQRAN